MRASLKILHLEDSRADAELVGAALEDEGFTPNVERVETRESFVAALGRGGFDLILSDFTIPGFSGLEALAIARQLAPSVPFIFTSGTIGEDQAVESLKLGATDYVLKHRLQRLAPVVRRAMEERRLREERRAAEEARQRLEEQLRQAQKMEALGQFVSGIAHDFNNILTVILANVDLVAESLPHDMADQRADLDVIAAVAGRGRTMIKRLLAFSRREALAPLRLDLGALVRDFMAPVQEIIPSKIVLSVETEEGLPPADVDPGVVEQILLNLVANARDAMPQGGTLTVSARRARETPQPDAAAEAQPAGEYVCVAVADTGIGMDDGTRRLVFEPFFTTKPRGKGTGLGMAMVYGLVRQHGGFVVVQSEPGKGTTVELLFPAASPSTTAPSPPAWAHAELVGGAETLLVVDDEPVLLRAATRALQRYGYTVLAAADGQEAFEAFGRNADRIRLVVSDMIMPHMTGVDLFRAVREAGSPVKFLFVSGYEQTEFGFPPEPGPDVHFIMKPWTVDELARAVRTALDG